MNILIAPNSMKGSLNAAEFADCIEKGFRSVSPVFSTRRVPVADGGDFSGKIIIQAMSARVFTSIVSDPLGRSVEAQFGISDRTAIIEMAAASGIGLLGKNELNPELCTTHGTGQLIKVALEKNCNRIILGVGGSATIDGGTGMLEALGFSFFDSDKNRIPGGVHTLYRIRTISFPESWPTGVEMIILTDVDNPLLGPNGAATVFGPQKGAYPAMISRIEAGMENWVTLLEQSSGKQLRDVPGMGAAGGIASGLVALLDAKIVQGADFIFNLLEMDKHIRWADWVITGEGRIDLQSLNRKAPVALAQLAKSMGKPVTAIAGAFQNEASRSFDGVFSLCNAPLSLGEAMDQAGQLVFVVSQQLARLLMKNFPETESLHHRLEKAQT